MDIEQALQQLEIWQTVADDLYTELVKDWCWHCGAEKTGHVKVDQAINSYRDAKQALNQ